MMSRSAALSTDNITSLQIIAQNFWVQGGGEEAVNGAPATISASVEYPAGTCTQIRFGGAPGGPMPAGGTIISDPVRVSIPIATVFWIRMFFECPAGIVHNSWQFGPIGDSLDFGSSGLVDKTLGGPIANKGPYTYPPLAIIGPTTRPSVVIIGDSIGFGYGTSDSAIMDGRMGIIAKSFPSDLAFCNLASNASTAQDWINRSRSRSVVYPYCSNLVSQLGRNDVSQNQASPAQTISWLQAIWALFPEYVRITQATITNTTYSSNGWADIAGQHLAANFSVVRELNDGIRSGRIARLDNGHFETCNALEPVANDGYWICHETTPSPGGPYTNDGIHPNDAGAVAVVNSGCINLSRLNYLSP